MNVMGRAFSNPKRDSYRTRLALACHLFVILCQEISELGVTAIAAPAMSSALRYVQRHRATLSGHPPG
jgi:hypothetical protein